MTDEKLSEGKSKKAEIVTKLKQKIESAKSLIFTDFRGLKHKQLEEARMEMKKNDAELVVVKNRIFLRALGKEQKNLKNFLTDTTAVIFAFKDQIAPIKSIVKFFKNTGSGSVKGGFIDQEVLASEKILYLASLPGRDQLLANLVGQLNAPISGLHRALSWNIDKLVWTLNSIKEKKG